MRPPGHCHGKRKDLAEPVASELHFLLVVLSVRNNEDSPIDGHFYSFIVYTCTNENFFISIRKHKRLRLSNFVLFFLKKEKEK